MELSHKLPRMTVTARDKILACLEAGCTCGGAAASLTKRRIGAAVTVHLQCRTCGRSMSGGLKRDEHFFFADYPLWDGALQKAWQDGYAGRAATIRPAREDAVADRRREYRAEFLRSPEWQRLRTLVMRREGGRCQARLSANAADVHHDGYDKGRLPPAWDLRAVCRPCHDRLHDWQSTAPNFQK